MKVRIQHIFENLTKNGLWLVCCLFMVLHNNTIAQVSARATASVRIVEPITISKKSDMNFGNIAVLDQNGTVELSPDGTLNPTGGVSIPTEQGSLSAASFEVQGNGAFTYSITLPEGDLILTHSNGHDKLIVNNFKSYPAGTGQLLAGKQTLCVGATLHVNANQQLGYYQSSNFEVIVNYN